MKMNKNFLKILLCTALAMTALGGCARKAPVEAPKESATVVTEAPAVESEAPAATPEVSAAAVTEAPTAGNTEQTNAEATISICFADEELLAQPQSFYEFVADESEYQVKLQLSTDLTVTNFRVLSLNIENFGDDGTLLYSENELYTLYVMTPEKPLVLAMTFAGDIPNMGISYVDANGMKRVYAIGLSGKDGSPYLVDAVLTE